MTAAIGSPPTLHCASPERRHVVEDADAKLAWRVSLPGASTYDRAADVLRRLQASGANAVDLLPLAMPTSWMVNAKANSRAMQRWQQKPMLDAWGALLELVAFDMAPDGWLATPADEKEMIGNLVAALASGADGATLTAITKVLALLRPQLVPLMDDAAIAFALGLVPMPETAEKPSAPPSAFVPMLDWFARAVVDNDDALVGVAARHTAVTLDQAQTLDRLLWVESWGKREMPK